MKSFTHKFFLIFWILVLFFLPFTSLPLTSKLLKSTMVAAPSIIFMGILFIFWLIPKLFRNENIYFSKPFILFFLVAVFGSLLAYFLEIPVQKNFSLIRTQAEGLITLSIGAGFYFVISNYITKENILKKSIQIMAVSMIPLLLWSGVQLGSWFIYGAYPDLLLHIQSYLSTSGNLYNGRVTGFAFEPSWFAHTLTMVYIPLWLGLTVQNISVFDKKIYKFSFENVLLVFSVAFLIFSKSRIGLISFGFMLIFLFFKIHLYLVKKLNLFIIRVTKKNISQVMVSLFLLLFYAVSLFFSLFFISKFDQRMENLLNPATYQNQKITSIANEFQIAERVMYWQAGWRVFNNYPILGVGLGNSGFFFEEKLPAFAWALDEPRNIFYRADYLPNNKNLWTKLLSETGILGFSTFFVWLLVIWSQANLLKQHKYKLLRAIGYSGLFALISFGIEGFSIDSFALPYYWVIPGFISATFQYLSLRKSE